MVDGFIRAHLRHVLGARMVISEDKEIQIPSFEYLRLKQQKSTNSDYSI